MTNKNNSRFSLRNLRTFDSLKNPVYRLYFSGSLGLMAAMNMHWMTNSLLIYRITGSATMLGLMSVLSAVPQFALGLFGGTAADRMQKKNIIIVAQSGSALVALGIAFTLTTGYISPERNSSWWVLIVNSVLQGTIWALMQPSRQAIIPEIVSQEQVMNAVALNSLGMNTLRLLAPALAGFLIDAFDFQAVFYAMTGLYMSAVFFTSFIPATGTTSVRGAGAMSAIKDGLKYISHETTILAVIVFTL
ncbi:MAG: MFS transporter, partial [Chloroflexi bacterium]|nr:MFS transporter [Chloroflexota bacterium]